MDVKMADAIYNAVKSNADHIKYHLNRGTKNKNVHIHINHFRDGICDQLNVLYPSLKWTSEKKTSGIFKDKIDILGEGERPCIIEIDAARHDQIAAKFVSRLALCGLDKPIDYVAVLYESSREVERQMAGKYIQYMYSILQKVNSNASLLALYVDRNKNIEIVRSVYR